MNIKQIHTNGLNKNENILENRNVIKQKNPIKIGFKFAFSSLIARHFDSQRELHE